MKPKITADEFERQYCERGKITIEEFRKYRKVVPCDCDFEECQGWCVAALNDSIPSLQEAD